MSPYVALGIECEEQSFFKKSNKQFTSVSCILIISSPEPKAHGELIVYQSSRRPSVRLCVCPHFQTLLSPQPAGLFQPNFI